MSRGRKFLGHTHKYQKVKWGKKKTEIFRCMLPDCPHYVHIEMAKGRKSLCWGCLREFIMTTDKLDRTKPKCNECMHKSPRKIKTDVIESLDSLLEGLDVS